MIPERPHLNGAELDEVKRQGHRLSRTDWGRWRRWHARQPPRRRTVAVRTMAQQARYNRVARRARRRLRHNAVRSTGLPAVLRRIIYSFLRE